MIFHCLECLRAGSRYCWAAFVLILGGASVACAQDSPVLSAGIEPIRAGNTNTVWLNWFNTSTQSVTRSFPPAIDAELNCDGHKQPLPLLRVNDTQSCALQPGAFARAAYSFVLPKQTAEQCILEIPAWPGARLVLDIQPAPGRSQSRFAIPERALTAQEFFKAHFFGYEPFYFIAGLESPNARFQVSFRYQLLNEGGWVATRVPFLKGINFAYTQTSLWDLGAPSSPFLDSSYKPEALYLWENALPALWPDWLQINLRVGVQHESNGRDGEDSRSLNILYFSPTVLFGKEPGFHFAITPRVWTYLPDLDDNPDLENYRGYADLRTRIGWTHGLQLAAIGRLGDDGNRGSLQLDLTYPVMQFVYLHVQYFIGYGESLLHYNERGSSLRAGLALYR